MRKFKDYLVLSLKGMAMGAADVVPGVSGGTIAFISGIYEELLDTISSVNLSAVKTLKNDGIKAAWKAINGNFIVAIFLGIGISIVSLAKAISYFLEFHPIMIWSFFFGLVLASVFYVGKQVKKWNAISFISLLVGAGIAYYVTILPPMVSSNESWFIFMSGMIAICAMILPGISGSFILLLLGSYQTVLGAVKDKDIVTIAVFMGGCVIGLLSFSRLLKWMFAKFHDLTIALLTGFLIGSLNKLWPWKQTIEVFVKHAGEPKEEIVPIIEKVVLPNDFSMPVIEAGEVVSQTASDPKLLLAIAFCFIGAGLIFGMEFIAKKMKQLK